MTHSFPAVVSQHSFGLFVQNGYNCWEVYGSEATTDLLWHLLELTYQQMFKGQHDLKCDFSLRLIEKYTMIDSMIETDIQWTKRKTLKHFMMIIFHLNMTFNRLHKVLFLFHFSSHSLSLSFGLSVWQFCLWPSIQSEFPNGNDLITIATCNRNVIYAFSLCFDGFFYPHNMIIANYIRCLFFNDDGDYIYFVHWPHRSIYTFQIS